MNSINIRQLWFDYYHSLGFKIIPGAPLVHPAFPMSFNMSAGLVQLDPKIRSPKKVKPGKQVLIQKCFRHFDIDKVGDDTHLTFFEMPGIFEIGEFDEVKTVEYIWKFLTEILHIDSKRLWITSFYKDNISGTTISQSKRLIKYLQTIAPKKVILSDKKTNLWMQGGGTEFKDNIRMCGPQVEFYYEINNRSEPDLLSKNLNCRKPEQKQDDNYNPFSCPKNFLEIGNIISIKYYVDYKDMKLKRLINPSTEAVIGLERTNAIVEPCQNQIFRTSYFSPLIKYFPKNSEPEEIKIITNHLKSLLFILTEEEILPGKSGRNRIIRTLIRNLLTSCYVLQFDPSIILSKIINEIIIMYKDIYPEIKQGKERTLNIIFDHEKVFQKTLETGKRKIQRYIEENKIKEPTKEHKIYFQQQFGYPTKLLPYIQYEL